MRSGYQLLILVMLLFSLHLSQLSVPKLSPFTGFFLSTVAKCYSLGILSNTVEIYTYTHSMVAPLTVTGICNMTTSVFLKVKS